MAGENEETIKQAEEQLKKQQEEKVKDITTKQVVQSSIGFFLPEIVDFAKQNTDISGDNRNVFMIEDEGQKTKEELPVLTNILTKKQDTKVCDLEFFNNLRENSLFLNEAVPYVKIYKTVKNKTTNEYLNIELPFDIVAGQKYGNAETLTQKILSGGSGGAVGVMDFSWKSEGKNEGNNSIYTVNFKILMQDASELEKIRNRVDDQEIAILDLLYYGFLKEGIDGESSFDPDYLEFKAEVGFNFSSRYAKYKDFFRTVLNLRVYKHNFSFNETGKVELDIIAIGNIESDYSNKTKYNILESSRTQELRKTLEFFLQAKNFQTEKNFNLKKEEQDSSIKKIIDEYEKESKYAIKEQKDYEDAQGAAVGGYVDIPSDTVEPISWKEYRESIETLVIPKIREDIKVSKASIINTLIDSLHKKSQIKYFVLDKQKIEALKLLISFTGQLSQQTLAGLQQEIASLINFTPSLNDVELNEGVNTFTVKKNRSIIALGPEDRYLEGLEVEESNALFKTIKEKLGEEAKNSEIVSFVYLGDLLQAVIDQNEEDLKNDLNLYLSPFSFFDYKSTFSDLEKRKTNEHKKITKDGQTKYYNTYNLDKKISSLYYVPISIATISKWFKDHVIAKEEQAYTFNTFIKFCMSDLIKQNISVKVAPSSPNNVVKINPYYFSTEYNDYTFENKGQLSIDELSKIYSKRLASSTSPTKYKKNIAFLSVAESNSDQFVGNFTEDCEKGVLHLPVNSMYSFVKRINFSRDDDALLETANLQAANDANPNKIIRQVYQANVEMFGNSFFEPGNLVYLSPNYPGVGLQNKTLIRIGLGGYYRITEIDNKVTSGGYSTTLRCIWEMSADGQKSAGTTPQQIQIEDSKRND